ncbi:MAG: hypothetical protein KGL90_13545 [Burkholderiales bacterium]|nr:hypothetical protein [Burkholderiales bacterium]
MIIPFKPNDIIANTPLSKALPGNTRVLAFDELINKLWLIGLPAFKTADGKSRHIQDYLKGPYDVPLDEYCDLKDEGLIYVLNIQSAQAMPDSARLLAATSDRERESIKRDFWYRDRRYTGIKAIVCLGDTAALKPTHEVLMDRTLPKQVNEQATAHGLSVKAIYHYLHLFWAGGSHKNALSTRFTYCGNPGEAKPQRCHLGRKPNLFHDGLIPTDGYPLTDDCKEKLKWGFRLVKHGTPEHDAYLMTMAVHWAEHVVDPSTGEIKAELFETYLRPTFEQFSRWGELLNGTTVTAILLGPKRNRQRTEAKGGSEQDQVAGIGQMAGFDATSDDVYLTRLNSRIKRLPPMTRMILKEVRLGLIYGLYCGWEPPSPATALQTILHGASPDKAAWAARFGVEMPEGAMPAMLARTHIADNGELKAEKATEAEQQFGFGIDVTPTDSGDRKGGVESQHRSDHAQVDHKVPGSTFGHRPKRGDVLPVTQALWNYYEYMRELILHIIWHNTIEEVPELAPDDMLLAVPPIPPTRINIFNWLTQRGMNKSLPINYDAMKAFCLPDVDAVIRKNGIYIEAKVNRTKQALPRLRYTSDELVKTGLMSQVKRTGSPIHTRIKMDTSDLSRVWLPTKAGLIEVFHSARDTTINTKLTLTEWIAILEDRGTRRSLMQGQIDQHDVNTLVRRQTVTDNAKADLQAEIKHRGKGLTKAEVKRGLLVNRSDEIEYLQAQERMLAQAPEQPPSQSSEEFLEEDDSGLSAAELLMESIHQKKAAT